MDIMSGLSAASKALDIVKALRDLEGQANDATFKLQIAELHSALADAKIALSEAKERLANQEQEIARLQEVQGSKMEVVRYKGFSFGIDEDGEPIGRPFCRVCEANDGVQIQLTGGPGLNDFCPRCNSVFNRRDYPYALPIEKHPKNQTA